MNLLELFAVLRWDASEYEEGTKDAENKANSLSSKVGGALKTVGKLSAGAVTAAGTAIVGLTKAGAESYGQYEQLVGGVETLFGAGGMGLAEYAKSVGKSVTSAQKDYNNLKKAESIVLKNSEKAFKTAGLSANAYMEQATSTAAALIGSLDGDTVKAAQLADQAIIDMSDNANKMGTSMESIQYAYNGFAKGNYTMLDNLKLGFGGTKEEMQRLLDKAGEISGYKYDISSYADIVDAIHVVQTEMGITGTTVKEAGDTIKGSGGSIKAAWENLVTSFGRGREETGAAMQDLVDSVTVYIGNIVPRLKVILENIGAAIVDIVPIIMDKLPGIVSDLLPGLLTAAVSVVTSIIEKLPDILVAIFNAVKQVVLSVDWMSIGLSIWNAIKSGLDALWTWITDTFPEVKTFWEETLKPTLDEIWTFITETLVPAVKTAWEEDIGPAITETMDAVSTFWTETLKPALDELWTFITETLVPAIQTAWEEDIGPAITETMGTISTFWTETLQPALSELWTFIVETLVPAIQTAWEEKIGPIITAVMELISTYWTEILQPALSELWTFVTETLAPAIKTAWEEGIGPVVVAAMKAIYAAWTEVLLPAFVSIVKKVNALLSTFKKVWEEGIAPVVKTVMDGIKLAWEEVLQPALVSIAKKLGALKETFKTVFEEYISPTIDIVFKAINTAWTEILLPVFVKIAQILSRLQTTFKTVWEEKIGPLVDTVFEAIKGFYDDYLAPVFDGIATALDTINETWDSVFNGMKSVVDTVFGDGEGSISSKISGAIDFIQGLFDGIDFTLPDVDLPHFVFDGWSKWGPISIPNVHVEWYRKAYDNPIMFNSPTVLPTFGGLKGFGDGAGGEIVMSERKLRELTGGGATTNNVTFNVYAAEGQDPEEIARAVQRQFTEWEDQRRAAYI